MEWTEHTTMRLEWRPSRYQVIFSDRTVTEVKAYLLRDTPTRREALRGLFGSSLAGTVAVSLRLNRVSASAITSAVTSSFRAYAPRLHGLVRPVSSAGSEFCFRIAPSPFSRRIPFGVLGFALVMLVCYAVDHVSFFLIVASAGVGSAACVILLGLLFRAETHKAEMALAAWAEDARLALARNG